VREPEAVKALDLVKPAEAEALELDDVIDFQVLGACLD
jgi:hypothetical protein